MPVLGPMRGFSSRTSSWHSFSASGSLIKVLLQDELRRHGIDRLLLHAAQPAFRLDRGKAFVDPRHRQAESPFEAPRELFDPLRQRVLASLANRQPDHELRRFPFRNQLFDLRKFRNRGQRMSATQLRLADCNSNTLETEIEGEDGALVRHAPPSPAVVRSRPRAAPLPRAAAPPLAFRR